jgi:hypothetical protein
MTDELNGTPPNLGSKRIMEGDGSQWNEPKPDTLPSPTYWPAALAFAVTITAFGVVTSLLLSALGMTLFVVAIAMWIREIRHEQD